MTKRNQIKTKAELNAGDGVAKLSASQAEILTYLQAGLSTAQIAAKRKCSRSYVRRVRRKLEEKGLYDRSIKGAEPKEGYTPEPAEPKAEPVGMENNVKRVHAQRFEFTIFHVTDRFREGVGQHLADGTWVQVHGRTLFVYAAKRRSFSAPSTQEALSAAYAWWLPRLRSVERDLGCSFLKPRKVFRVAYTEIATEESGFAEGVIAKEGAVVRVFHPEDGKLRVSFDKSQGYEHETHHARDGVGDDEALSRHINAMLDNRGVPTLAELSSLHRDLVMVVRGQVEALSAVYPKPYVSAGRDSSLVDYFG